MKTGAIFVVFFILFTCASLAVTIPMFPGNLIERLVNLPYIHAVTNGMTYGFITWIVFFFVNRKIDRSID